MTPERRARARALVHRARTSPFPIATTADMEPFDLLAEALDELDVLEQRVAELEAQLVQAAAAGAVRMGPDHDSPRVRARRRR